MTIAEKAIKALTAAGLDARKPANYTGETKAPFLFVQDGGEQQGNKSTCKRTVVLYVYVPYSQPGKLPALLSDARAAMRNVRALRLTSTSEEAVDDTFKAITASLTYTALCAK